MDASVGIMEGHRLRAKGEGQTEHGLRYKGIESELRAREKRFDGEKFVHELPRLPWKLTKSFVRSFIEHKNPFSKENTEKLDHEFKVLGKMDRSMYWLGAGTKGLLIAAGVANPAIGLPALAGFALAPTGIALAREGGGWLIQKGAKLLSKDPETAVKNWKKFIGEGKVAQRFANGFATVGFGVVGANLLGEVATSSAHAAGNVAQVGASAVGEKASGLGTTVHGGVDAVTAVPGHAAGAIGEKVTGAKDAVGAGLYNVGQGVAEHTGASSAEAATLHPTGATQSPDSISLNADARQANAVAGLAQRAGEHPTSLAHGAAGPDTGSVLPPSSPQPDVKVPITLPDGRTVEWEVPKSVRDLAGHAGDPDKIITKFAQEQYKLQHPGAGFVLDLRDDTRPLVGLDPNSFNFLLKEAHWNDNMGVPFIDIQDASSNAIEAWNHAGPINEPIDIADYMRRIFAGMPNVINNGQIDIAALNANMQGFYDNAISVSVGDQLPYATELTNEVLKAQGIPDGVHISPELYNQVREAIQAQMKNVADGAFRSTVGVTTVQELPHFVDDAHNNFVDQLADPDIQDALKNAAQQPLAAYHAGHSGRDWWAPGETVGTNPAVDLYPTVGSQAAADVFQEKIAAAVGYYLPQTNQVTDSLLEQQYHLTPAQVDPAVYEKMRYIVQQKMETMATDEFVKAAGGHYTNLSNVNLDLDKVFADGRTDFTSALRAAEIKDFYEFNPGRGLPLVINGSYTKGVPIEEIFLQNDDRANVILEEIRKIAATGIGEVKPVSDPQVQALLQDYINDPGISTANKPEEIFANIAANYEKIKEAVGHDKNIPPNFHLVNPGELPRIMQDVINGDKAATDYLNDILGAAKRGNFQYTIVTSRDPAVVQDLLDALRK